MTSHVPAETRPISAEPTATEVSKFTGRRRAARWLELCALFGLLPVLLAWSGKQDLLIPFLLCCAAICLAMLLPDPSFSKRRLWNIAAAPAELPRIVVTFVIGAVALYLLTLSLHHMPELVWPELLDEPQLLQRQGERLAPFAFPQRNPRFYLLIMLLYPIFSVYPQELIFRAFFAHRYAPILPRRWMLIVASGIAFAWAHIIFRNWVAVALCIPGGMLFMWTYLRTRSTAAAGIEHALFGDWIWTIGLGYLFYSGSVQ